MKMITFLLTLLVGLLSTQAFAQTTKCSALDENSRLIAQQLMDEIHSYGWCTDSLTECLKNPDKTCKTPEFLADDICRMVSKNTKKDDVKKNLELRTKAMDPNSKVYTIEIKPEHLWGNPEAKTILTVYLCGRCPYCSRHVPQLIRTLEKSSLKDKIAVNLRYFPIKAHNNSTPAALAIEAAAQLNHAWDYLIKSYDNFDAFTLNQIIVWSRELGLDADKMSTLMKDPAIRATVSNSKKEGLMNGVTTTPTFFINGRRIEGKFDVEEIISMLEEEEGRSHD